MEIKHRSTDCMANALLALLSPGTETYLSTIIINCSLRVVDIVDNCSLQKLLVDLILSDVSKYFS